MRELYNLQRPHQGIGGLVPADRFFHAAPEVLRVLKERAAANALELAQGGIPRKPFYLTGSAGGQLFSVHAEGERVILRRGEGEREEIDLTGAEAAGPPAEEELPLPLCPSAPLGGAEEEHEPAPEPGVSALDGVFGLDDVREDNSVGGPGGIESQPDQDQDDERREGGEVNGAQ